MPPKRRGRPRKAHYEQKTPTPAESVILDPQEIIDLEIGLDKGDQNEIEPTANGDISLEVADTNTVREETMTIDSNGPVERIPTPQTNAKSESKEDLALLTPVTDSDPQILSVEGQLTGPVAPNTKGEENVLEFHLGEDLSDDEGTDIIENKVSENLNHQTERLFDLIEELQKLNQSGWCNSKTLKEILIIFKKTFFIAILTLVFLGNCYQIIHSMQLFLPIFLNS